MNHRDPRAAALLCGSSLVSAACAADVTGYAVLTTDYVFRGVTYSDGHAAVQAGADIALDSGLYLGVWGSSVDISGGPTRQRDLQLNYYLGYTYDLRNAWSIGANVVSYTFPGTEGDIDYDSLEYSMVASFDDRIWLEYSHSPDLFHSGRHTHNVDLHAEWPLRAELMLGAGAGYYDVSELTGSGYAYWQLGVTRSFGRIDVDLRYHDTNRAVPIISSPEHAKARIVLSAKLQF
ncbi:MAG: TorF family putative porin [Woeseia sp.]